jgi:translation initiation factor IF-2
VIRVDSADAGEGEEAARRHRLRRAAPAPGRGPRAAVARAARCRPSDRADRAAPRTARLRPRAGKPRRGVPRARRDVASGPRQALRGTPGHPARRGGLAVVRPPRDGPRQVGVRGPREPHARRDAQGRRDPHHGALRELGVAQPRPRGLGRPDDRGGPGGLRPAPGRDRPPPARPLRRRNRPAWKGCRRQAGAGPAPRPGDGASHRPGHQRPRRFRGVLRPARLDPQRGRAAGAADRPAGRPRLRRPPAGRPDEAVVRAAHPDVSRRRPRRGRGKAHCAPHGAHRAPDPGVPRAVGMAAPPLEAPAGRG